jgi:hypothetical protein
MSDTAVELIKKIAKKDFDVDEFVECRGQKCSETVFGFWKTGNLAYFSHRAARE